MKETEWILPLQKSIVYGPVNSRRLGKSLGINLLSVNTKVCSFDCLYCQYGFTQTKCDDTKQTSYYPTINEVEQALEESLAKIDILPDYITFSGNGEATLHPQFVHLVDRVLKFRNRHAPRARTAILSNSTEISDPQIRKAIMKLDDKIMKLDCGTEEVLQRYNRPRCPTSLAEIINNLGELKGITLQALFTKGKHGNYFYAHINDWLKVVARIRPTAVQIYSLARGTAAFGLLPVDKNDLAIIAHKLNKSNIIATVY
jgi:wyosine [tRNA(Phe)-imidazoG37] synthetase (radical SAM superfamily)